MTARLVTRFVGLPAAVLLSLVVAAQAAAAGWGPSVLVAEGAFLGGLATLDNGTALVMYERCVGGGMCEAQTAVKRSTDGGETWGSRFVLPGGADMGSVGGYGTSFDLVFRDNSGQLGYTRSTNSGLSFREPSGLSKNYSTEYPRVARGPGGLVAVSWGEWPQFVDRISARVSTDGGRTFGPRTSWPTDEVHYNQVAVGEGVVYVAHRNANGVPVIRRSMDGGQTWTKILRVDVAEDGFPTLAADGNRAVIAYTDSDNHDRPSATVRRTTDNGSHWSQPSLMAPNLGASFNDVLTLQGGVLRALVETEFGLYYTECADAVTWTEPELVVKFAFGWIAPTRGLGFVGRPMVAFEREPNVLVRVKPN
jgi:hypothetical protein